MLYGDPTVRYVDFSGPEESSEAGDYAESEDAGRQEKKAVRGSVRGMDEVVAFPPKKQKWILAGSALLLLLSVIIAFSIFKQWKSTPNIQKSADIKQESKIAKEKRIDELVAYLIKNYKGEQKTEGGEKADIWKSRLPAIVFLNIRASGLSEADNEYIFSRITDTLQNSKRVLVVEREILNKLLEELKLSSSNLANPATALKIGKILSARLITTGSIVREGRNWQVSLRLIEPETSTIKAALTENLETEEKDEVAERLSREMLKRIRAEYPLRGKILSLEGDSVFLDIGYRDGVAAGYKMNVLSEDKGLNIGELEIISVEENTSIAKTISQRVEFKEGLKTRESL
jgi:hypothetical protein